MIILLSLKTNVAYVQNFFLRHFFSAKIVTRWYNFQAENSTYVVELGILWWQAYLNKQQMESHLGNLWAFLTNLILL